jgi:hypothetical protein
MRSGTVSTGRGFKPESVCGRTRGTSRSVCAHTLSSAQRAKYRADCAFSVAGGTIAVGGFERADIVCAGCPAWGDCTHNPYLPYWAGHYTEWVFVFSSTLAVGGFERADIVCAGCPAWGDRAHNPGFRYWTKHLAKRALLVSGAIATRRGLRPRPVATSTGAVLGTIGGNVRRVRTKFLCPCQ